MNLFPFQKIYTKKEDLNLFLIDILNLITSKKIYLFETMPGFGSIPYHPQNYITVYDKDLALPSLSFSSLEYKKIQELDYYKFQSTNDLKNYYNLRFSFGFRILDLITIWNYIYKGNPPVLFQRITSPIFLFLYLNLFPYQKTWRLTITNGNQTNLDGNTNLIDNNLNFLAQDILHDYFQSKMFIPKVRS
jgi:hypothetical protein